MAQKLKDINHSIESFERMLKHANCESDIERFSKVLASLNV